MPGILRTAARSAAAPGRWSAQGPVRHALQAAGGGAAPGRRCGSEGRPGIAVIIPSTLVLIVFFAWLWFVGLPQLALLVRRLHDIGKSGWWILLGFVPVVGPFILLIFTLLEGTPGLNRYQL